MFTLDQQSTTQLSNTTTTITNDHLPLVLVLVLVHVLLLVVVQPLLLAQLPSNWPWAVLLAGRAPVCMLQMMDVWVGGVYACVSVCVCVCDTACSMVCKTTLLLTVPT